MISTKFLFKCMRIAGAAGPILVLLSVWGCGDIGPISAEQSAGYEVYKEYCGQCHERMSPKRHVANDWPDVVDRMRIHMKEKKRREITDEQASDLLIFLRGHAKDTK